MSKLNELIERPPSGSDDSRPLTLADHAPASEVPTTDGLAAIGCALIVLAFTCELFRGAWLDTDGYDLMALPFGLSYSAGLIISLVALLSKRSRLAAFSILLLILQDVLVAVLSPPVAGSRVTFESLLQEVRRDVVQQRGEP
jgi:hypothetical protein